MHKVAITEAESTLAALIEEAANGEEVVISDNGGTAVLLVPLPQEAPTPKFGSAKGQIWMAEDFDEPLDDFAPYMS